MFAPLQLKQVLLAVTLILCFFQATVPSRPERSSGGEWSGPAAVEAEARQMVPAGLTFASGTGALVAGAGIGAGGTIQWQAFTNAGAPEQCMGYAGPLTLLVGINRQGEVTAVKILSHQETPSFVKGIEDDWFLEQFRGKTRRDAVQAYIDLDGITHATVTVDAICRGVRQFLDRQGAPASATGADSGRGKSRSGWEAISQTFSAGAVLALGLAVMLVWWENRLGKRVSALLIALGLGFATGQFVSLAHIPMVIRALRTFFLPGAALLILVAAAMAIAIRPRGYCAWLCPMGRLQDGLSPLRSPAAPTGEPFEGEEGKQISGLGRWLFWGFLLLSPVFPALGGEQMEVFSALFLRNQGGWGWLLVAAALIGSLATVRFYCRLLCPMNALFQDLETIRATWRAWREQKRPENTGPKTGESPD